MYMYQVKEMTDEEQLQMFRDNLTFDQLALMHIELLKHIPTPTAIYPDEDKLKKDDKYGH